MGIAVGVFTVEDMCIEEVEVLHHKFKSFLAISKEINVAALAFARYGQSHMMTKIWIEEALMKIQHLL